LRYHTFAASTTATLFQEIPVRRLAAILATPAILLITAATTLAAPPAGYYDSVDLGSQETLRQTLHDVIDGHTRIPYTASSTDTWNVLELADQDPENSSRILDVYRNRSFPKFGGGNTSYNREHTWPNSYGFPDDNSGNYPYTDCHQLFLCDISYNGARGSRVYDDCTSGCTSYPTDFNGGVSGINWTRNDSPQGVWETWSDRRGDVARAMFYMDVRYEGDAGSEPDLILTDDLQLIMSAQTGDNEPVAYMGYLTTLLEWHEQDPVDDKERDRNDVVFQFQGNRNPFIDNPEWVDLLFGDGLTAAPGVEVARAAARIDRVAPNPFNPRTEVVFTMPRAGAATVAVYGLDGRRVATLWQGERPAGEHRVTWDGRDLPSGSYLLRLQAGGEVSARKVTLLK
jgi:endonuclease I